MSTPKVKKQVFSDVSMSGFDSAFDVMSGIRAELDNAKLAALGFMTKSVVNDFSSISDAAFSALDVTVPGATLGDYAMASLSVTAAGLCVTANVTATDVVTVLVYNESGGAVDLAATVVVSVAVLPRGRASCLGLVGQATYDMTTTVADNAFETSAVTVTGAALGDFVLCSFSLDVADVFVNGQVTAADTVTVVFQNHTNGTADLSSGTVRACVLPKVPVIGSISTGALVSNLANIADAAQFSFSVPCPGARLGDHCVVSCSLDVLDGLLTGYVAANDAVVVLVQNESGTGLNLAEAVFRVMAMPSPRLIGSQFEIDLAS